MRRVCVFVLLLGVTTAGALFCAQEASPGVPVQMVVTAEARHGKDVPRLSREDAMVFQGRERRSVTDWVPCQGEHANLELFLLVDDASGWTLGSQLGDLRQFIEAQPAATAIGIGYMRNGTVEVVRDLTADHRQAAQALRLPLSSGGVMASPYLSLSDLIKRWPAGPARREVLLITSGADPLGGIGPTNPYLDAAIEHAQRAGIIVYAIYTPGAGHAGHSFWRMHWGQNYLAKITEESGGEAYFLGFGPPVSFAPYLEEISEHLNHQYRLTFLAKPEKKAGLQGVRITTELPNTEIVAATQVYVPARR